MSISKEVMAHWDGFWKEHPEYATRDLVFDNDGGSRLLDFLIRKRGLEGKSLLEIGGGPGTRSIPIGAKYGMDIYILDCSKAALDLAKIRAEKYGAKVKLIQGDMLEIPLIDDSIDVIFGYGPHDHFFNGERQKIFDETFRVNREGGICVPILPSAFNPCFALEKVVKELMGLWEYGPTEFFTPQELVKRTVNAGYKEVKLLGAEFYTSFLRLFPRRFIVQNDLFNHPTSSESLNEELQRRDMMFTDPLNRYLGGAITVVGCK